ncbi:MAG: PorV/PorQ family protein [Elusimicrobiota bacterium]
MKIIYTFFIIFLFSLSPETAFSKGPGTSAGLTLLQPISARGAAMGGACSAMKGEAMSIGYNPAGLASFSGTEFSTTYQRGLAGGNMASLYMGQCLGSSVLGMALIYYSTGKLELFDATGVTVSETGQRDLVIIMGSGENLKKLSAGLNLKFITSQVFGINAFGFAADMGLQFEVTENINTGISLQNLGTKLKYIEEEEDLPLRFVAAASYVYEDIGKKLTFSLDLPYLVNEEQALILLGGEARFEDQLFLRMGLRFDIEGSKNIDEKFDIGWGINFNTFQFNHSVGITGNLSIPQRFTVSAIF